MTMTYAIIALGALALLFGLILGYASIRFKVEGDPLVDQIDEILPQTQCGHVATLVVNPMQKPLLMVMKLTNAPLVVSRQ